MTRAWSNHLLLLCLLCASVWSSLTIAGAHDGHSYHDHDRLCAPRLKGGLFPFLNRLRDNVVQLIFRPSSVSHDRTTAKASGPSKTAQYQLETVLRFNVTTQEDQFSLQKAADRLFLDVWDATDDRLDVRVRKDQIPSLLSLIPDSLHSDFAVLIPDLAEAIWLTYPSTEPKGRKLAGETARDFEHAGTEDIFFQQYQTLSVINQWMRMLASMFPTFTESVIVGQSSEDRNITGLRLGTGLGHRKNVGPQGDTGSAESKKNRKKKTIVLSGGSHAREWISTSTVSYLAWSFISDYGDNKIITDFLDRYDVLFVPVMNPDGYEYTWSTDRLWRKTRQTTNTRYCQGLDLDHTFSYRWDSKKREPCSESYGGQEPFQAAETRSFSEWVRDQKENHNVDFVAYFDFHSYSQEILYPFSHSCDRVPRNLENMQEAAYGLTKAIRLHSGEPYTIKSACGAASDAGTNAGSRAAPYSGSAIDWFHHDIGSRFTYQIKLRDTGAYGFLLPSSEIVPTGHEMYYAIMSFADYVMGNNGIEKPSQDMQRSAYYPPAEEQAGPSEDNARVISPQPDEDEIDETGERWIELRRAK